MLSLFIHIIQVPSPSISQHGYQILYEALRYSYIKLTRGGLIIRQKENISGHSKLFSHELEGIYLFVQKQKYHDNCTCTCIVERTTKDLVCHQICFKFKNLLQFPKISLLLAHLLYSGKVLANISSNSVLIIDITLSNLLVKFGVVFKVVLVLT